MEFKIIRNGLGRYKDFFKKQLSNFLKGDIEIDHFFTTLEEETNESTAKSFANFFSIEDFKEMKFLAFKSDKIQTGEQLYDLILANVGENGQGKDGIFSSLSADQNPQKQNDDGKNLGVEEKETKSKQSEDEEKKLEEPHFEKFINQEKVEPSNNSNTLITELLQKYEKLNEQFTQSLQKEKENQLILKKFEEKLEKTERILEEKEEIIGNSEKKFNELKEEIEEMKQRRKEDKEKEIKEKLQNMQKEVQLKKEQDEQKKKKKLLENQKKDEKPQENKVAIEGVSDKIEPIKKSDFYIEFRIKFPFEKNDFGQDLLKFMGLTEIDQNQEKKMFITNFFNHLLSRRMICELPNQNECDLVPFRCREDKFGQWRYDFLFDMMKIFAVLKSKDRSFPIYWKLQEGIEDMEAYDIRIFELKDEQRAQIDENMPISAFFKNIEEKTGKKKVSEKIRIDFEQNDVKTVKDLMNIKATTPEVFSKYYSIKVEIYEELDRAVSNSVAKGDSLLQDKETFFCEEKKQIDYTGRAFKIVRYFYSVQNKANDISFLNKKTIDEAYKCIRKEFLNEDLLLKIKSFYQVMTKRPKDGISKLPRGILFYGPPGTGKTTVGEKFPDLIGLTSICTPLSSTELNRSLVGETEQLITQICERAKNYPHLLCYLSIDEIDAMVPRRDDKENKNKGDTVTTLLALIGGNKDVPNLVFIASTNFIKKIDEAFSRRMNGKFFVGRMDSEARKFMLNKAVNEFLTKEKLREKNEWEKSENINYFKSFRKYQVAFKLDEPPIESFAKAGINEKDKLILIEQDKLNNFNVALINFTSAAMENLSNQIKTFALDCENNYDFTTKELLEFAMIAAKQINIKFGIFFIPEIYINLGLYNEMNTKSMWKKPENAQGLVVVDLCQQLYNFKTMKRVKKENTSKSKLIFEERPIMNKDITNNVNDIIDDIAKFANDNGIQTMQLIDLASLINNQAFDEQKMQENINEIVSELKEYAHSLLVFDLDSLISTNVSESSSSMGPSTSLSLNKINLFYYIRDLASTCPFLKYGANNKLEGSFWIFLVSHDKFLLKYLTSALKIEKSEKEQKRLDEEEKSQKIKFKCLRCQKLFHRKDNKDINVCQYHVGYVFDSSEEQDEWRLIDLHDEEEKKIVEMTFLLKEKKKANFSKFSEKDEDVNTDKEEKEEEKDDDNPFFYICCRKKYNDQGCKNNYHLEHNSDKDKKEFEKERDRNKWEEVLRSYMI